MTHTLVRPVAAPGNYSYFSNTTNLTYVLSTYNRTFEDSSMECKLSGGSLVTYRSLVLQQEVEKYYIDQGLLFPFWHKVSQACWVASQACGICALSNFLLLLVKAAACQLSAPEAVWDACCCAW